MRRWIIPFMLMLLMGGCTHTQLRNNTVRQAQTLADLHQQQVLDNLAMFIYDSNSLPHFAYPDSGQNQLTDTGSISSTIAWKAVGFDSANLNPGVMRAANEVWTLHPINDPYKLALMRCAYQKALESSEIAIASNSCPDCACRLEKFYKGHPYGTEKKADTKSAPEAQSKEESLQKPQAKAKLEEAEADKKCGKADDWTKCLEFKPGWFSYGSKKNVPRDCCGYVGHYCGVYVWVPPPGRNELTKLTLAILDFALYDPHEPEPETKEIVVWVDAQGKVTKQSEAVAQITARVPVDKPLSKSKYELIYGGEPAYYPKGRTVPTINEGLLQLKRRLEAIK